jgi:hypothetical protein
MVSRRAAMRATSKRVKLYWVRVDEANGDAEPVIEVAECVETKKYFTRVDNKHLGRVPKRGDDPEFGYARTKSAAVDTRIEQTRYSIDRAKEHLAKKERNLARLEALAASLKR